MKTAETATQTASHPCGQWESVPVKDIKPGRRAGRDTGELDGLAACIAANGLLNPVTITQNWNIVLGPRRLEACRLLGWASIPAVTVTRIPEALIRMEEDAKHACCAVPPTPREAVGMDDALRELEWWPRARPGEANGRRRRDTIARLLGMNTRQYRQARALVLAAAGYREEDRELYPIPPAAKELAASLLADVKQPGQLNAAYSRYQRGNTPVEVSLAGRRLPSRPQKEAITESLATLAGLTRGLSQVVRIDQRTPSDTLSQWEQGVSDAISSLQRLRKVIQGARP